MFSPILKIGKTLIRLHRKFVWLEAFRWIFTYQPDTRKTLRVWAVIPKKFLQNDYQNDTYYHR